VRLVRALELHAATGLAPSLVQRRGGEPRGWRILQLALDPGRVALDLRIDARCEAMLGGGLLQEVRRLRDLGYGPELPSMRAIGYRHMQAVVDGLETLAGVLEPMQRDTRRFARRQRTWLRAVAGLEWLPPEPLEALALRVKEFLGEASG
jgi:tRNA dimethylallyltransferase